MSPSGNSRDYSPVSGGPVVKFPIVDGHTEFVSTWISPFESQTPDAGLGTFGSMLQVGGFLPIMNALQRQSQSGGATYNAVDAVKKQAAELIGATSITKLNSTQVNTGAPPLKHTFTAVFRALKDPQKEVVDPVDQLISWALPELLAEDGALTNLANGGNVIRSIFPSKSPSIVAFSYAGETWPTMVIESIGRPLTVARDAQGRPLLTKLSMQVSTLSALDREDYAKLKIGR